MRIFRLNAKITYLRLIVIVLAAFGRQCATANAVLLVENHKAKAIIVVPEGTGKVIGPVQTTNFELVPAKLNSKIEGQLDELQWYCATDNSVAVAAMELQTYIQKATGAHLEIKTENQLAKADATDSKIFVGPCKTTASLIDISKIQPEGFVIKIKDNDVYIVGKDKTEAGMQVDGTLNGSYEFLKRYVGVRWLMPGELGEVVPKAASLKIGQIDVSYEPLLWQRRIRDCELLGHGDKVLRILENWGVSVPEWQKHFSTQITGTWFRHHRLGARVKLKYTHAYNGWWDRFHLSHPDIFALQPDGTRILANVREQFCISNPEFLELVVKEKINELKGDAFLTAASISPNEDGENKFCCCEKCAAWDAPGSPKIYGSLKSPQISLSDRYFRFYNEVAKRVAKEVPGRYLGAYAYSYYKIPPVTINRLESNLLIGLYGFDSYLNDRTLQADRNIWLQWGKITKQLFIRPNLFWYGLGLPANYTHKIASDIRFMADNGMRAADFDGLVGNWGSEGLDYYVTAELLWNPYADVNVIIDDYCKAAYGNGAPAMKAYYERLETLTNTIAREGRYTDLEADAHRLVGYYTDDVLNELGLQVDKALATIGTSDSAAVARVKLVATALDYTLRVKRLVLAAYSVRTGQSAAKEFETIKTQADKYFASLAMSWSVSTPNNYIYVKDTLSLTPVTGDYKDALKK